MADIFPKWDNEVKIEREEHSVSMRLNKRTDINYFIYGHGSSQLASWGNPKVTLLYSIKPTVHNFFIMGLEETSVTYELYADVCQWPANTTVSFKIVNYVNVVKRRENGSKTVEVFCKEHEFTISECELEENRRILLGDDLFPYSDDYSAWSFVKKFHLGKKATIISNINVKIVSVICRHSSAYDMNRAVGSSIECCEREGHELNCALDSFESKIHGNSVKNCFNQNLNDRKDSRLEAGEATRYKKPKASGSEVSGLKTSATSESGASGFKTSTDSESGAAGLKTSTDSESGASGLKTSTDSESGASALKTSTNSESGASGSKTSTDSESGTSILKTSAVSGLELVAPSGQEDFSSKSSLLADDIARMYANPDNLADLILDMKDRIGLSGHRFILSARSPVLKKKIAQLSGYSKNQSIEVEIPAKPMTLILHWMYTDKLHENVSKLWDQVLDAAKKLEMRNLTRILEENIMTFVNHENMIEMYQNTKKRGMEKARKEIAKYIKEKIED